MKRAALFAASCLLGLLPSACWAQFAAAVTPPRFELRVEPGAVSRNVFEITHAAQEVGNYRVYSSDWSMDATGSVVFHETLQPDSCRPWVSIERRDLIVPMGARVRFRYEVAPPAETAPRECRFALMVESKAQEVQTGEFTSFPMSGRIGIIVYVSVAGASPMLELRKESVVLFDGQLSPAFEIQNTGNATGRVAGIVQGIDATGSTIEFSPDSVPILPGQTRVVTLQPYEPGMKASSTSPPGTLKQRTRTAIRWPLKLTGRLEYGSVGEKKIPVDRQVELTTVARPALSSPKR